MADTLFWNLKRGGEVENRPPVLDGDDTPCREGPPVADPVDLIEDRDGWISWSKEVGVQGMHGSGRPVSLIDDSPACGDKGLPATWPPKTRWRSSLGPMTSKNVDLDGFQVEQRDQIVKGPGHAVILPCHRCLAANSPASGRSRSGSTCLGLDPDRIARR